MKWYGYVIIGVIVVLLLAFLVCLIKFSNNVKYQKEQIKNSKSDVRIAKAKYLQVLRKVIQTQDDATDSQGRAYRKANGSNIGFINGAIGGIDSNFYESSELVADLADQLQDCQRTLNRNINLYNTYISTFPCSFLNLFLRYKKEEYVDSENLEESTKINGMGNEDI